MTYIPPNVHFRSARRSLVSTMELYGIDPTQIQTQVDSLVEAVRRQEREVPYRKEKRGSKWVVVKINKSRDGTESTEVVGKHDTPEQADKQLAALHINVEDA